MYINYCFYSIKYLHYFYSGLVSFQVNCLFNGQTVYYKKSYEGKQLYKYKILPSFKFSLFQHENNVSYIFSATPCMRRNQPTEFEWSVNIVLQNSYLSDRKSSCGLEDLKKGRKTNILLIWSL